MPNPLHVANGHCTTRLIEAAGLPGSTSIWADALHDGPVPNVGDERLIRVRAEFIADGLDVSADDVEADLKRWRAIVDNDDAYDELVLWFEHDLFDQLNLIQLLTRIGRDRRIRRRATLVSIDRYPGRAEFKGLGELSPSDIAALFQARQPVSPPQFSLAVAAWDAFRSSRARLEGLLREDTSALPFLAAALRRHLDETAPAPSGLTLSERRLIEQLAHGPLDIHAAFNAMHEGETAYYITDSSFWAMVMRLAARSPALIDVAVTQPSKTDRPSLPSGTLSLRQ